MDGSRVVAKNHAGWNVEYFGEPGGWRAANPVPYTTRKEAEDALSVFQSRDGNDFRVYEALFIK